MEEPDFRLWQRMQHLPLLGALAALAAITDLMGTRIALRLVSQDLPHNTMVVFRHVSELPRNLFAVCGLLCLVPAIMPMIHVRGPVSLARTLGVAGFAGLFLPMIFVATAMPSQQTTTLFVFSSTFAAHVLATIIALSTAMRTAPRGIRVCLALMALASMSGLAATCLSVLPTLERYAGLVVLVRRLFWLAEISFLALPFLIGLTVVRHAVTEHRFTSLVLGGVAAVVVAGVFITQNTSDPVGFRTVIYGAFGVKGFLETTPYAYLVPVAAFAAVSVIGAFSPDSTHRQAAAGLALLLAGGMAPSTPARLLMWVVGVAFVARAAMVFGERMIEGRAEEQRRAAEIAREPSAIPDVVPDPIEAAHVGTAAHATVGASPEGVPDMEPTNDAVADATAAETASTES